MKSYVEKMNTFLANQIVFYIKLHNLHWYIQGHGFFTLHAQYEKLYDEATEVLDEVAERLLQMDQQPVSTLKSALALADIEERASGAVDGKESIEILLKDYEKLAADTREIVTLSAEAGDDGTADQFTAYLRSYAKIVWMLKAYQK